MQIIFLKKKLMENINIFYVIPLLKELKAAGFGVYYLSNYSRKAYNECGESLSFMPFMDGGIVSFRAGMTKPDPEMYRRFLDEYGLSAAECLFVDDTKENVDVALSLGFDGIVYEDEEKLKDAFRERGISMTGSGQHPDSQGRHAPEPFAAG